MTDFIEIYDDALPPDFCRQLIDMFERSPHREPGRAGGQVDPSKKKSTDLYLNVWPDYQPQLERIVDVTTRYATEYFRKYRFALIAPFGLTLRHPRSGQAMALTHDTYEELIGDQTAALMGTLYRLGSLQLQKYDAGEGNYRYWHCEVFPQAPHNEALHRTLLFMFYLNDVEDGGETDFYYQDRSIQPRTGRMVIAPAYFTHTHRGRVPVSNDKYILTSWILMKRAEELH